jgi:hypothetical protein
LLPRGDGRFLIARRLRFEQAFDAAVADLGPTRKRSRASVDPKEGVQFFVERRKAAFEWR